MLYLEGAVFREFIETELFQRLLEQIGDKNLEKGIKEEILKSPKEGVVIPGSGGVRKIRIKKGDKGKSGSYRVLYLDLVNVKIVYLLFVFEKGSLSNISNEQKRRIRKISEDIKNEYKKN